MSACSAYARDGLEDGVGCPPEVKAAARRRWLLHAAATAVATVAGQPLIARAQVQMQMAASLAQDGPPPALLGPMDAVFDLRDPRQARLDEAALRARLTAADVLLLGERHDEPEHHVRRGSLLLALALARPAAPSPRSDAAALRLAVVAEQLLRGRSLGDGVPGPAPQPLLPRLQAAGFDPRSWGWPLYEPLFAPLDAARRAGLALELGGANLPLEQVRRAVREGEPALPPELTALLQSAPLQAPARARLDADLRESHCGQMPEARLPGMRLAQRARDAAMWQALAAARRRADLAVLLAGNGHVRLDYGVPVLAAVDQPAWRVLSVGFGVIGESVDGPYDLLWQTPGRPAEDPCGAAMAKG